VIKIGIYNAFIRIEFIPATFGAISCLPAASMLNLRAGMRIALCGDVAVSEEVSCGRQNPRH
jgi:hypothetical protein